nr:retrovirus-related Pol polyprotein from transposon TNT 1-94 [Tanacetum cinerariifolium]
MSTQQDIYAAGSENRPPMLNKENYVPWLSRLLREINTFKKRLPVDDLKAKRLARTQDPLALMATSNNPYTFPVLHQDQPSFNQNYMQQPMPNPKDITDSTTAMYMALALIAKAFKLNYPTPINNNKRISSNPRNRQISQPSMNMGQDRRMQMIGGNGRNQFRQYAGQNVGNLNRNQNGLIVVPGNANLNPKENDNLVAARTEGNAIGHNGNQIRCYNCRGVGHFARNYTVRPRRRDAAYLHTQLLIAQKEEARIQLQAEEFDLMAAVADLDEIEEVNANCILMANLQKASTLCTQTDKAPVYDSDGSAEVHNHENCYDNEIFNMFTQEKQYTELLKPILEPHQVPQNNNNVISEVTSMEQSGGTVEQHPTNVKETRVLYDSLYHNLAIEVEKVNTVNRKVRETNAELTTELAGYKNEEKYFEISQEKYDKLERCYQKFVYQEQCLSTKINALYLSSEFSDDTTLSVARNFLNEVKSTIVTLQRVVKQIMTLDTYNWSSSAHQELHKIVKDEIFPIVNQVDARVKNFEIQFLKEATKFVGDFKSLAKEVDESLAKHKALELEIERLLRARILYLLCKIIPLVKHQISKLSLNVRKDDLKTVSLKRRMNMLNFGMIGTKSMKNANSTKFCTIKLIRTCNKRSNGCKLSWEISKVLNYAKENAYLKTTYKNLFDSISVTRTQTKIIIDSLQNKLHDTIYENAKLRARLIDKVSNQKDTTRGTSANTKFAKQSILGKPSMVGKTHALSKPVTSNSIPSPQESKVMKNDKVISPGMFRINPFQPSRKEKHVPNKVRASVRTKPITISQPPVFTKKVINSDSNGLSSTGSSCSKNKEVDVEEHRSKLLLSRNKKHLSSECNNVKLATQNVKSKVVCAMCKQCLISVNYDVCLLNYVNDMKSRGKKQNVNVSINKNQKKQKLKVKKTKKVGSIERLASPKPSKPRSFLRWSPTGRLFDLKGKIIVSSESETQSDRSKGDNACTSNPLEPTIKQFPNSTFFWQALYGLKHAPRAWYNELSMFLLQNHFFKGTIDPTLFIRHFGNDILVVQVYVDDIIFDSTHSRSDIEHATCLCARYQAKPTEKHLKEVKRIFRYFWGNVNTSLWYTKDSGFKLTGFSDADYARCKDTFKSTSGGAQFLGEKLVSWSSKKQDYTTLSTAEAEYVSLSACCAQVLWMRTLLTDYGFHFNKIPIYYYSKSAIAISCNLVQYSRTKHIAVRYHFIKEHVEKGTIKLYFVKTDYQLADIFTKALLVDRYNYLVRRLAIAISCNLIQHSRTKHIPVRYHFIKEHVEKGMIELYFVKMDYQLADLFTKALPADCFNYLVRRLETLMLAEESHLKMILKQQVPMVLEKKNSMNSSDPNPSKRPTKVEVPKELPKVSMKPTGKVFTKTGYTWRPTGQTFTIVGNACHLTRITTTSEVPLRKPTTLETDIHKPVITLVYSRKPKKSKNNVPVSKLKIIKSKSANNKEPSKSWGPIVSDVLSSSLDKCRNDHMERIMGYGDYQIGNATILRIYYVEGLGHNLFFVGKFCDSNLEVAFRQHTWFIHNLEGVDLLTGSRGNNLYTLSLGDMIASFPICLLSKASKTKSWLWHRRLSHLNFGTINL